MKSNHIEGLDYVRAVMSVFVVVWHMGGGGRSLIFSKENYPEHLFTWSDLVNFHLLLLAVPTFIFISCFLHVWGGASNLLLKKRLKRILVLLTFWPIALVIWKNGYHGLSGFFSDIYGNFIFSMLTAGDTIYYFFVNLTACLLLTHLTARLAQRLQIAGLLLSLALLATLPQLTKIWDFYPLSAYWDPLNFIPYPFAAVLFASNMDYVRSRSAWIVGGSMVLFVLFSILEWNCSVGGVFFEGQGFAIPAYTRMSLLFAAVAIAAAATDPRVRAGGIVRYMSRYSLALYCLHPFLILPVRNHLAEVTRNGIILTYGAILLVILSCYGIATLLRILYLKEDVIT